MVSLCSPCQSTQTGLHPPPVGGLALSGIDLQDLDGKVEDSPSPSRAASRTSVHGPSPGQSSQPRVRWQDVPDALADLAAAAARSASAHKSRGRQIPQSSQRREQGWFAGDVPSGKGAGSPGSANVAQFVSSILSQRGGLQPGSLLDSLRGPAAQPTQATQPSSESVPPSSDSVPPDSEQEARSSQPGKENAETTQATSARPAFDLEHEATQSQHDSGDAATSHTSLPQLPSGPDHQSRRPQPEAGSSQHGQGNPGDRAAAYQGPNGPAEGAFSLAAASSDDMLQGQSQADAGEIASSPSHVHTQSLTDQVADPAQADAVNSAPDHPLMGSSSFASSRELGAGNTGPNALSSQDENAVSALAHADPAHFHSEEPHHAVPYPDEDGMLDGDSPAEANGSDAGGASIEPGANPTSSIPEGAATAADPGPPVLKCLEDSGQFDGMNKRELQAMCKNNGLPTGGLKHEIVGRLVKFQQTQRPLK